MKAVHELRRNFKEATELKSDDKLVDMLKIRSEIQSIEIAAMRDPAVPLEEIKASRDLLVDVDAAIGRLEAGQRRREQNSEDRAEARHDY